MTDKDTPEDTIITREMKHYRKYYHSLKTIMSNFEQKLIDIECSYQDSNRAMQLGIQNVYDKFIELEKRQIEIELLLNTDIIKNYLDLIPPGAEILNLISKLESCNVDKMNENIMDLRCDFEDFRNLFNF